MASRLVMPKRPHSYPGKTMSVKTGCGTIFVTISVDDTGYPIETFARGKGGCMSVSLEALGKTASIFLRVGGDAQDLVDQYQHMICPSVGWDNGIRVSSCAAALGIALKEVLDKYNDRINTSVAADLKEDASMVPDKVKHAEDLNNVQDEDGPHTGAGPDDRAISVGDSGDGDSVSDGDSVGDEARAAKAIMREQMAERERLGLR